MIVIVTDDTATTYEYEFDQESIIVGRGTKCDVVIQSDHISRKHLEIRQVEGVVYIKDLTLSNWVSYNEEKLVKNTDIQYFDFAPLILPGGISIKIEDDKAKEFNVSDIIKEGTQTRSQNKVDIYNTKLTRAEDIDELREERNKEKRRKKEEREQKKSKDLKMMVFFFVFMAGAFGYYYYTEMLPQSQVQVKPIPKKKIKRKKPKKKIKTLKVEKKAVEKKDDKKGPQEFVQQQKKPEVLKFTEMMAKMPKCKAGYFQNLCTILYGRTVPPEGVVDDGFTLHVMKNFRIRLEKIYNNNYEKINKAMALQGIYDFVAAEKIMQPQILEKLEAMRITKIKIYVFAQQSTGYMLLSSYELEPGIYRRYSAQEMNFAEQKVTTSIDLNYFNSKFARFLKEEFRRK